MMPFSNFATIVREAQAVREREQREPDPHEPDTTWLTWSLPAAFFIGWLLILFRH